MTPAEMEKVMIGLLDAMNAHDAEAATGFYAEDSVYEQLALGLRFEGRQGVQLLYAATFFSFPDFHATIEARVFGDGIAAEWGTFAGTSTNEFLGVAPTGKRFEVSFAGVFDFRDGRVGRERVYYDIASLCSQAGISIDEALAAARQLQG